MLRVHASSGGFNSRLILASVFLCLGFGMLNADEAKPESLVYRDLARRMTDMELLALLPPAGEKTAMVSSYDRDSQYDADKDQYIKWDANGDGKGFVSESGDSVVLADLQGPGCIWRIWSAAPSGSGHVKIFIDGEAKPALDLPFEQYFSPTKGPFPWPNLAYTHAGEDGPKSRYIPGGNIYVPIPFQKSCKIIGDKKKENVPDSGWGQYFQCNYTQFAPGTTVPSFKFPLGGDVVSAMVEANKMFDQCGTNPARVVPSDKVEKLPIDLAANQTAVLCDLKEEGAIKALKVKLDLPADPDAQRTLLRQLTIKVTWDNDAAPAIWSPLGDFFGTIGGSGDFQTLPVGLMEDGTFYCYWYMPFATHAKIELGNDSGQDVSMQWEVTHAKLTKPIASMGRFHAKWHRDAFPIERKDRWPDWTLLTTQGTGRYVGTMLHVWNPRGGWWGEGDEKFFIDGEKFPSTFGTGSEDYFGYAWGAATRFVRAFHAQPLNESNMGHVDNIRWHISDSLGFQTSFDGYIEKYFPNQPGDNPYEHNALFAAEVYWYLSPGGNDPYTEVPVDQRIGYWTPPVAKYNEPDAIEGESLCIVDRWSIHGGLSMQAFWEHSPGIWSGDKQLLWDTQKPPGEEKLVLRLPAIKAGKYKVMVRVTKSPTYAIFQLGVDGTNLGDPIDLYGDELQPSDPIELGTVTLTGGGHTLNVEATGKNPGDKFGPYSFGLDYIKLVPVP